VAQTHIPERIERAIHLAFQLGAVTATARITQVQQRPAQEEYVPSEATAAANTTSVSSTDWLASIVGAFDDDPFYARMIENMEENSRRMAAQYEIVE
jgi:hypothetical protein